MQSTKDTANAAKNKTADTAKDMTADATQSTKESTQQGKDQSAGFLQQVFYLYPFNSLIRRYMIDCVCMCMCVPFGLEFHSVILSCYRQGNR
jgi:hypothetical protein